MSLLCTLCSNVQIEMFQCECRQVVYCSERCAAEDWLKGHKEVHIPIGVTATQRLNFVTLMKDPSLSNDKLRKLIQTIYPLQMYPYQVRYQDSLVQPRLDLDLFHNRLSVTVRSAAQRLCTDYGGPWTPTRGGIYRWDTGAGKTLAIHSQLRTYRQELVNTVNPLTGTAEQRPRICLLLTESSLQQNVLKDVWGQSDANSEYIAKKIREAELLASDKPSPFDKRHVITARKFSNMLMGIGPAGRRLWIGQSPSSSKDVRQSGPSPTAYRLVEGEWVRGNRPWSEEGEKSGYTQFMLWLKPVPKPEQTAEILVELEQRTHQFPKGWKGATDWKQRAERTIVQQIRPGQFKVRVFWKRNQPSPDDWNYYVQTPAWLRQRLLNTFPSLQDFDVKQLKDWGQDKNESDAGYHLAESGKTYVWQHGNELNWNPLNQVVLFVDEADRLFDTERVPPGERANAALLLKAINDSPGMKIFFYSATINFTVYLSMLELLSGGAVQSLRDLPTLDPQAIRQRLAALLVEDKPSSTEGDELSQLRFSKKGIEMLSNGAKGLISDLRVSSMRDYFAKVKINDSASQDYVLSNQHAQRILNMLRQKRSLASIQAALLWAPETRFQFKLNNPDFSPDALAEAVLNGAMPAAIPLLKLLRKNDKHPAKQGITSSIFDDENGINIWAALLQAAGYKWLPVQRQHVDLTQLPPEKRKELDQLRNLGLSVPKQYRRLRLATAPLTKHSPALQEQYGPRHPEASNTFVVLSSSLIQADPEADEPESYEMLVQQLIDRRSFATRYAFHNTVAELREGGLDIESTELKQFRREIKGHTLYLWPGSQYSASFDSGSREYRQFISSEEPVWFIHRREDDPFTGEMTIVAHPINAELTQFLSGSFFERLPKLCQFNIQLSEDEKQDMLSEVMELYNSKENFTQHTARILLFGGSFAQGFDILDTRYQNNVDVAITNTERIQRAGRYNRRNGMPNIPFAKRKILISTLVPRWNLTVPLSDLFPSPQEQLEMLEPHDNESPSAFNKRREQFAARLTKRARNYGLLVYEQRVLNNIEGEPLGNKTVKQSALTDAYLLQPYEALRVLDHDPFLDALNIAGAEEIRKMAYDAAYTEPQRDRGDTPSYATTNWAVKRSIVDLLRGDLVDRSIIEDATNPLNPARKAILKKISTFDIITPNEVKALVAEPYIKKALRKYDKRVTEIDLIQATFVGELYAVNLFRRMAENPKKRHLYVGLLENGRPVVSTFRRLPMKLSQTGGLLQLWQLGQLVWSPNFSSVAKSRSSGTKRPSSGSDPASKRTTTDPDEMEVVPLQARYIGAEEEEAVSTEFYSNVLDAAPFPDDEQEVLERKFARKFKKHARQLDWWAEISEDQKVLLTELYEKRFEKKLPKRVPINLLAELRLAIVKLYEYGIMQWARALKLLAHFYMSDRTPAGTSFMKMAELIGPLFRIEDSSLLAYFPQLYEQMPLEEATQLARFVHEWSAAYSPVKGAVLFELPALRLVEILDRLQTYYLVDLTASLEPLIRLFKDLDSTMSERGLFKMHAGSVEDSARELINAALKPKTLPLTSHRFPRSTRKIEFKRFLTALQQGRTHQEAIIIGEGSDTAEQFTLQDYVLRSLEIPLTDAVRQLLANTNGSLMAIIQALLTRDYELLRRLNAKMDQHAALYLVYYLPIRMKQKLPATLPIADIMEKRPAPALFTGFLQTDGEPIWYNLQEGEMTNMPPIYFVLRDEEIPMQNFWFTGVLSTDEIQLVDKEAALNSPAFESLDHLMPGFPQCAANILLRRDWTSAQALIEMVKTIPFHCHKIQPSWTVERLQQLLKGLQAVNRYLGVEQLFKLLDETDDFSIPRVIQLAQLLGRAGDYTRGRMEWLRTALASLGEQNPETLLASWLDTRIYAATPKEMTDETPWTSVYSKAVEQAKKKELASFPK